MRITLTLFALALTIGCDEPRIQPHINAPLTGHVQIDGSFVGAQAALSAIFTRSGDMLLLDETVVGENGAFTLETNGERGPFKLALTPPGQGSPIVSYVPQILEGVFDETIYVTPVTAITAGLADHAFETALAEAEASGMSVEPRAAFNSALAQADALIDAHFFGVDHERTAADRLSREASSILEEPPVLAGLALDGLAELARQKAQASGLGLDGFLTTRLLTEALVDDIRYDGTFDGVGQAGPVVVLNQRLDGQTLRRDYALSLLRFIESDRDLTAFNRADIRHLADRCAQSTAPIFPPDARLGLEAEAPLIDITPKDGAVVAGEIFVQISASDAHLVDGIIQESDPRDFGWRDIEGVPPEFREDEGLWHQIKSVFADSTVHPDGYYTVTARAWDELDNFGRAEVTWIVDNSPPRITIHSPAPGAVLTGDGIEVYATAEDPNGLVAFTVTTPDGVVHAAEIPEQQEGMAQPSRAELRLRYNALREVDGIYALAATAEDVVRNTATEAIELQVDNAAPAITFRNPRDGMTISGVVPIIVDAEDASSIEHFVITTPDGAEHLVERDPQGEWRAEVGWDSTSVFDGRYPIIATVTDVQGSIGEARVEVVIDNIEPGVIAGAAVFDSPIAGLIVEAWSLTTEQPRRLDLCAQSRAGACVTDEDGAFEITVVDDYAGPVTLTARADQNTPAEYVDAATGEPARIIDFDLRTLLTHYAPGQRHDGLVFSAASTLVADWLLANLVAEIAPDLQARVAIHVWGQHLCPVGEQQAPCDPTATKPQRYDGTEPDFVPESGGALLGLVQAGLSRRAADLRLRHDEQPIWGIGLLRRLRLDLNDGLLDGLDGDLRIRVDNHPRDHRYLDSCSLRSGLTAGIGSFLNKTALLNVDVRARNQTGIEKPDMQAWLEGLSTRAIPGLWPDDAVCRHDGEGPRITIVQPEDGAQFGPAGGSDSADWRMRLQATAEDDSLIGAMWLELPAQQAEVTELNSSPDNYLAEVDYAGLAEGPLPLIVRATDLAGNPASVRLEPQIDLTPPDVNVFTTSIADIDIVSGEIHYLLEERIETTEDDPFVTDDDVIVLGLAGGEAFTVSGAQMRGAIFQGPWWWAAAVPLNAGLNRIALTVTDLQGNADTRVVWILRDTEGPRLELVDSGHYQPERTLRWREAGCVVGALCSSITFDFDRELEDIITPDELVLGRNRTSVVISKFHDNWDHQITDVPNQPTLNFRWFDALGAVDLEYRVLITDQPRAEGACCEGLRFEPLGGWRPLATAARDVAIPIRPETVDPDLGLVRPRLYRIEVRVTNRAGLQAHAAAMFEVQLIAPPLSAKLRGRSWRDDGYGVGGLSFDDADLLDICDRDQPPLQLSRIDVLNPWPYPIRILASGDAVAEQFDRKAWVPRGDGIVGEACLGEVGTVRLRGTDARCYDEPAQLPGVLEPQRRVHREQRRVTLSGRTIADRGALRSQVIGNHRWLIIEPRQPAQLIVELPACDLPFQGEGLIGLDPEDRRILEVVSRHSTPQTPRFDRYVPARRVSRVRLSMQRIRLNAAPLAPATLAVNWHGTWTDSHTINNEPLSLPDGIEGDE